MKTQEDREARFRKDLAELLSRHKAEMEIEHSDASFGSAEISVSMLSTYHADGEIDEPYCEFNL